MPRGLRPLLGRLFSWTLQRDIAKVKKHLMPLLEKRLQEVEHRDKKEPTKPRDFLDMMLRYAKENRPEELNDLDTLTRRVCFANFAAMHQTTLLITNLLLNIVGSNAEFETITGLRDEAERIVGPIDAATWTKAKVARMTKTDSAARETLRVNSSTNRGLFRKVLVGDLVTEQGIVLPQGSMISFLTYPLQNDAEKYEDPERFDPFRFSRPREASPGDDGKPGLAHLSFVSTSPEHLPFGHGSHSCPGRFLVDFEVKMIMSYILEKYDLQFPAEYNGQRPPNVWIAEAMFPSPGAQIQIRSRQNSEH